MRKQIIDGISGGAFMDIDQMREKLNELEAECRSYKSVLRFYAKGMGLNDQRVEHLPDNAYVVIPVGRRAYEILYKYDEVDA